tara:strand:+ start:219 stop:440 length:222 start_codon:yes stop_codon:yes gene_type:complete
MFLLPLFGVLFVFLYLYYDFLRVSKKIHDNINEEINRDIVKDVRDSQEKLIIERDDECLYNHQNLCQEMLINE